jgi:hypothetical protein
LEEGLEDRWVWVLNAPHVSTLLAGEVELDHAADCRNDPRSASAIPARWADVILVLCHVETDECSYLTEAGLCRFAQSLKFDRLSVAGHMVRLLAMAEIGLAQPWQPVLRRRRPSGFEAVQGSTDAHSSSGLQFNRLDDD